MVPATIESNARASRRYEPYIASIETELGRLRHREPRLRQRKVQLHRLHQCHICGHREPRESPSRLCLQGTCLFGHNRAFLPNGEWVASAVASGTIRIWGTRNDFVLKEFRVLSRRIDHLQLSPDSLRIVACGEGK
ncbi:uncharacterized protein LOC108339222 [Vigna angularis]|uniref:uncharacterized protein LOC108339222 n=1 Tax=Phaseolus angularis TaxID=3914 RepID=UPI000809D022|nr:uncharacterized protein LOC108339222 [Vigna angularis]